MKKRSLALVLAAAIALSVFMTACSKEPTTTTSSEEPKGSSNSASSTASSSTSATDLSYDNITFPDSLPSKIIMAEDGLYDYDDMTKRYAIEIMLLNYGEQPLPPDKDAVNQLLSKQFNIDINLTAPAYADYDTILSARMASGDVPDVFMSKTREQAFTFSDQSLLVDAKNIYPYMKHSNLYTTKNMIAWSTNPVNEELPFITKYAIQDGVWGFAIRKDWLNKFKMTYPTTREQLMAYAKACTENDPDGNGKKDTYFMTANAGGVGWGMFDGFATMFGNNSAYNDNGQLSHPYFNNVRKQYLELIKEFYDAGVLAPDWFTLDWDQGYSAVNNNTVGMVRFPVGSLYNQYCVENRKGDMAALDVWDYWVEPPIEGGKYEANGNPGNMWCFSKAKFQKDGQLDMEKIKRVAHMIDTMTVGNENFFNSIQGSNDKVFEAAGVAVDKSNPRIMEYTDKGMFYVNVLDTPPYDTDSGYLSHCIWQQFGLNATYQEDYTDANDPYLTKKAERTAKFYKTVNMDYPRWENTALLVTLSGAAAEAQATNRDWILAQEYAFVTGSRSLDEYNKFGTEWLNKGGKEIIKQTAECLGVPVPEYAK